VLRSGRLLPYFPYYTRLEMLVREKDSSLFGTLVSRGEKSFVQTGQLFFDDYKRKEDNAARINLIN
jgi:hypothetical protein